MLHPTPGEARISSDRYTNTFVPELLEGTRQIVIHQPMQLRFKLKSMAIQQPWRLISSLPPDCQL